MSNGSCPGRPPALRAFSLAALAWLVAASPLQAQTRAVQVPYRPLPPAGADYDLPIPPLGPDGVRLTINKNLTPDETLWHVRSAWNVAALNCLEPEHRAVLDGYKAFLKTYSRELGHTNAVLAARYRTVSLREKANTRVYNYFTVPTVRTGLCDAALAISKEFLASPPPDAATFAAAALPRLDAPFEQFFSEYDQYRRDATAWDEKYGAQFGSSQPGYVAVHGVGGTIGQAP